MATEPLVASDPWRQHSDYFSEDVGRRILSAETRRLKEVFPSFRRILNVPWKGVWKGTLTPFAQPYCIRVSWCPGVESGGLLFPYASPRVDVLSPALIRREAEPDKLIPHLYRTPEGAPPRLCLYYPDGTEYTAAMWLAETVVPWAAEWLACYEMWHITGDWSADEKSHAPPQPKQKPPEPAERAVKNVGEMLEDDTS